MRSRIYTFCTGAGGGEVYSHEGDNEDDGTQELGAVVKLDHSAHSSDVHNRSFCDYNFKGEDWQVRATDRKIERKVR